MPKEFIVVKIMHLIHGLSTGGAETLVKNYMLNFDRQSFDVVLLCLSHKSDSPYEGELKKNNIRVIYVQDLLPFKEGVNIFKKTINYFYRFLIIKRLIRKEKLDILHTHLFLSKFVKFARPRRNTVIFHTVHSEPKKLWLYSGIKSKKDFRAAKWLIKRYAMKFIVLHDDMRKEINKMFGMPDAIVLNNGIDVEKIRGAKGKKQMRGELHIPSDAFVVGHIGRFSQVKNHDFLIDIFLKIKEKNQKAFLLMVGDGANRRKIAERLDDFDLKNDYLILSNRNDVADLISTMDVFVFPSLYEGLPLSLVEAQVAKKPCFISDTIGTRVMISNLVTRLPLSDGSDKWASTILNYKKPKKIILNDADWDIRKVTKQLEQIYLNALVEKQNGNK